VNSVFEVGNTEVSNGTSQKEAEVQETPQEKDQALDWASELSA
jgi:hypothetical protein